MSEPTRSDAAPPSESPSGGATKSFVNGGVESTMLPPCSKELPQVPGYEVLAELGRGAMGVVYRVRHLKLERLAALKMIRSAEHADRAELERFLVEARAVAALRHPHIVQVHEIGEQNGLPYFTLELVEGGSLWARLGGQPQPARKPPGLRNSWPAQCSMLTRRASSIAISSRATCYWSSPRILPWGVARPR
jgi:serine/threonine protein kinase